MKYYLYISDAKVDMLLPQIPHELKKKVATEFGFDLKILTAKRKVETEYGDDRIARLETVVEFIRRYGNLGSVDEPNEYIEGTLPMRFSIASENVAYFSGRTEKTLLGLGGSSKHLIGGGTETDGERYSGSVTFFIMNAMKEFFANEERPDDRVPNVLEMVAMAAQYESDPPDEHIEF